MKLIDAISAKFLVIFLCLTTLTTTLTHAQGFAWAQSIVSSGGSGIAGVSASTTDVNNNVYFIGSFNGTPDFDRGPGVQSLTAVGNLNMFVLKTDAAGNFLWVKHVAGISSNVAFCFGRGIGLDAFGQIYVGGTYRDSFDFDPGPGVNKGSSLGGIHSFVLKLSASGDFIWVKDFGSSTVVSNITMMAMKMDAASNIYFASSIGGTTASVTVDVDPGPGIFNIVCPAATGNDVLIEKLDSAGTFVWAKQISGSNDKDPWDLALDNLNNVYITGQFRSTADFDPGPATVNLTAVSNYDVFIAKYNSSGNYEWAKQISGGGDEVGNGIATDTFGNVMVTGYYAAGTADFDPGLGVFNITASSRDMFVLKLRDNGNFAWAKSVHPSGNDAGIAITVDGMGNVYTTGSFFSSADFDPGPGVYTLSGGVYIQKLDSTGNFVWARDFAGVDPISIALDQSNDIYVTGSFTVSADFDPGPGVFTLTGGNAGFIEKLCGSSLLLVANDSTICAGASAQLSTPTISGATYVWTKDGSTIAGSGNTINATQAGAYEVFVSGGCPSASGPLYISVDPLLSPTISILGSAGEVVGQPVTINATVTNAGPGYSINWKNKGVSFATTVVPSVTYTKQPGNDTITAFVTSTSPGCYDSTLSNSQIVSDITSIAAIPYDEEIKIYPNPVNDVVTVDGLRRNDKVSLIDMAGKVVRSWQVEQPKQAFAVGQLSSGYYLLRIVTPNGRVRVNVPFAKR